MNKFFLGSEYHQNIRFFSGEINIFLKDIKNPKNFIEGLIKSEMERLNITASPKATTLSKIKDFIKNNNILTTTTAKEEGIIKQSHELQHAVTMLTKDGMDIKCISDKRPFVYYYGITEREARKRTKKDNSWRNQPRVRY